jgi:hypothetical protein
MESQSHRPMKPQTHRSIYPPGHQATDHPPIRSPEPLSHQSHWVTWVTISPPHHLAPQGYPSTRAIGSPIHPTSHQAPTPQIHLSPGSQGTKPPKPQITDPPSHRATGPPFTYLPQVPGPGSPSIHPTDQGQGQSHRPTYPSRPKTQGHRPQTQDPRATEPQGHRATDPRATMITDLGSWSPPIGQPQSSKKPGGHLAP